MEDSSDPLSGNSLQKKKSKKKKKKNGGKPEQESQEQPKVDQEKQPQQATDRDETIIRTTKCSYCGKNVRQLLRGFKNPENVSPGPVVCEICLKTISQQKDEYNRGGVAYVDKEKETNRSGNSNNNGGNSSSNSTSSSGGGSGLRATTRKLKETLCNCVACVSKRENTVTPDIERDAHITQSYWMEIRRIVRSIYRDKMSLSAETTRDNIGSDNMRGIVRKLCCRDPHQFFQRLETLAREFLLEVKVRLLEQLSCGFNSPQLAIDFIRMLLDEYSSLCAALPSLLYLLEPLEETEYIRRLGVTIELVNKNIFRELIFAESFMSSNLPLIIAQLRLASLSSDPFHRSTADALSQRYNSLDDEMDVIGNVWNTAKDQLKQQQEESKRREERRAHIEKILSDGELFIKKHSKKENQPVHQRNEEYATTPVQVSSDKIREEITDNMPQQQQPQQQHSCNVSNHKLPLATLNQSLTPPNKTTTTISTPPPSSTTSVVPANVQSSSLHSPPPPSHPIDETPPRDEEGWLSKEQVAEWSKILFKCIKPIGEPEFRITDSIATHTITLKIDMTAIDLRHAESVCTHEQVKKYEELGMRREEIAEVALKLNAIKHLGINLRIDDLFDEHGFVIVEGNDYHEDREDAVYFVEEGKNSVKGKEKLMEEEMNRSGLVNLQHEKEKVICREKNEVGEGRETDLLQSMTMKIRFMKSVADEDMRTRLMSDSEQVMFESCDQVQMKLTQLELNTMRLMCTNKCLATNLGIRKHMTTSKNRGKDDEERFVHTDTNQPFVGLLLEQGKQAEQLKKDKEEKTTSKNARDTTNETKPPPILEEKKDSEKQVVAKVPEQVSSSESTGLIRPAAGVCIPSQSNSCQCFACIGAVAAQITEGSLRPLNPVDPSGSKLTIKGAMSAKLHTTNGDNDGEQLSPDEHQHSNKSVSNKAENLWQNWMSSTTHDNLPEDVTPATPPIKLNDHLTEPTTTPEHASTPPSSDHTGNTSSSSSTSGPLSAGSTSSATACTCSNGGGSTNSTITTATTATSVATISTSNASTSSGTSNGTGTAAPTGTVCINEEHHNHSGNASHKNTGNCPVKRYCPCCYCELFGQNTVSEKIKKPTVPTSHNYTKQRDKMRQKLEKKRKQEHVYCHHRHHHDEQRSNSPVDVHQDHHHHHHHTPHPQPTPSPPPPSSSPLHPTAVTTGTIVTSDSCTTSSTVTTTATAATSATTTATTSNGRNSSNSAGSNGSQHQKKEKSLDEILKFIEGKDFNESSSAASTSKSKKKKKGKRKTELETAPPLTNGHIVHPTTSTTTTSNINTRGGGATSTTITITNSTSDATKKGGGRKEDSRQSGGTSNSTPQLNGGLHHQLKKGTTVSHAQILSQNAHKPSGRVNSPKQSHKKSSTRAPPSATGQTNGLTKPSPGRSDNQLLPDSNSFSDLDEDYDREIEEFKKLCLSSAPVESRKKIHVSLNMQDIRSKVK